MQRQSLWEVITDDVEVERTVNLLQLDDMSVLAVMPGGTWDAYNPIQKYSIFFLAMPADGMVYGFNV